jgi:hypothetical protein
LSSDEPLEDWVFSTTVGAFIIANLVMIAGFVHLLYQATFWIIIIGSIILNIDILLRFIRTTFSARSYDGWKKFAVWEKMLASVVFLYLAIRLFNTFVPPITWDATTHHYLVPLKYLEAGYIFDFRQVIFSYYPSLIEMLYLFGMGLANTDLLANHIGWLFGPLTVGAVYIFGTKYLTKRVGLVATAILLSLWGIGIQMDGGYVDLPQALFCLLCLHKLLDWRYSSKLRDFILAAIFFSANLATKHLGFSYTIPVLFFIGYVIFREKKSGFLQVCKYWLVFIIIALIIPLPWYIRAYLCRDNPFFPFPVFGFPTLRYPPLELTTWVNPGFKKSIISLITYLWFLTTNIDLDGALGKRFTPYFLAMLPFFWVAFRKGTYVPRVLFWICLYFMGFVFYSSPVKTRYMLFFLPLMSLLAADIINTLLLGRTAMKRIWSIYMVPLILITFLVYKCMEFLSDDLEVDGISNILIISLSMIGIYLFILDLKNAIRPNGHKLKTIISTIVILLIFLPPITRIFETTEYIKEHTLKVILGAWDYNRYFYRENPRNWGAIDWMNRNLPPDALILAVETRMYGLKRNWISWLGLEDEPIPTSPEDNVYLWKKYGFTHLWIGDDATTKTLMYYNIYNLPGEGDEVTFKLEDLWYNFFGEPLTRDVISYHLREGWMPRELKIEGYEWYEDNNRVTDDMGNPLYKAKRSEIEADKRKMAQVNFVESIQELVKSGGLHIVYPPPGGKYREELTFILKTDYGTYKQVHEEVVRIGG